MHGRQHEGLSYVRLTLTHFHGQLRQRRAEAITLSLNLATFSGHLQQRLFVIVTFNSRLLELGQGGRGFCHQVACIPKRRHMWTCEGANVRAQRFQSRRQRRGGVRHAPPP
jgi:hypothetical protein